MSCNLKSLSHICKFVTYLVLLVALCSFTVQPLDITLTPTSDGAASRYVINNTSNEPISLDIDVFHRTVDAWGKETYEESSEDFVIMPPGGVIAANEQKTFCIQYVGEPFSNEEKAFRIVFDQLPVELDEAKARNKDKDAAIRILFRYVGSIFVADGKLKPKVNFVEAKLQEKEIEVAVENVGTAHGLLREPTLILTALDADGRQLGDPYILEAEKLPWLNGINLLPKHSRRFHIPKPDSMDGAKEIKAEFKCQFWN